MLNAVPPEARAHIKMIHKLAEGIPGVLILASYGEDPTTEKKIEPKVRHFKNGEVDEMYSQAVAWAKEPHRNVYMPLAVMNPKNLKPTDKGGEDNIEGVLGFVIDFDGGSGRDREWENHCPLKSHYVLRTSPTNAQCFYFLDKPLDAATAKALAIALTTEAKRRCAKVDAQGKDVSHVWRIPGLPNYPKAEKIRAGRDSEPFIVKVLRGPNA